MYERNRKTFWADKLWLIKALMWSVDISGLCVIVYLFCHGMLASHCQCSKLSVNLKELWLTNYCILGGETTQFCTTCSFKCPMNNFRLHKLQIRQHVMFLLQQQRTLILKLQIQLFVRVSPYIKSLAINLRVIAGSEISQISSGSFGASTKVNL